MNTRRFILGSIVCGAVLPLAAPALAGMEDRYTKLVRLYNDATSEQDFDALRRKSGDLLDFLRTDFDSSNVDSQEVADACYELSQRAVRQFEEDGYLNGLDTGQLHRVQDAVTSVSVVFHLINPETDLHRRADAIMHQDAFHKWAETYYPLLTVMMVGKRREDLYDWSVA